MTKKELKEFIKRTTTPSPAGRPNRNDLASLYATLQEMALVRVRLRVLRNRIIKIKAELQIAELAEEDRHHDQD